MPSSLRAKLSALSAEQFLLAGVPFLASVLALVYESGYLDFFDIPLSYLTLDFVTIVRASAIVALAALLYFTVLLVVANISRRRSPIFRSLELPTVLLVFFAPLLILFPSSVRQWVLLGSLCLVLAAEKLLPPAFDRSTGSTYTARLTKKLDVEAESEELRAAQLQPGILTWVILFTIGAGLLYSIVWQMGYSAAQRATTHWTILGNNSWVLVRRYGDVIILRSFDRSTRQIGGQLRVLQTTDAQAVLQLEDLGPLHPGKNPRFVVPK